MQEPPSVEELGLEEKRRILGWLFANVSAEVQPPPIQLSDRTQNVIAKTEPTLGGLGDVLEREGVERTPAAVSSFRELVMALVRITEEEAKIAMAREVEAQLAQLGIQVRLHVASDDDPGGQTATP